MKSIFAVALFLFFWPFSSGETYHLTSTNKVPAAMGTVQVEKSGANIDLDIEVSHLAQPSNLVPPESAYIVWVRPDGRAAIKKGAINIDSDLNGELEVVTTSKDFNVFITAEQSATAVAPSGPKVLYTHVTSE